MLPHPAASNFVTSMRSNALPVPGPSRSKADTAVEDSYQSHQPAHRGSGRSRIRRERRFRPRQPASCARVGRRFAATARFASRDRARRSCARPRCRDSFRANWKRERPRWTRCRRGPQPECSPASVNRARISSAERSNADPSAEMKDACSVQFNAAANGPAKRTRRRVHFGRPAAPATAAAQGCGRARAPTWADDVIRAEQGFD